MELQRITASLRSDRASGVVLLGEAGLGKSRLATECLDLAEQIGFRAKRAVASRAAANIPLGALAPFLPVAPTGEAVQGELLRWASATIVGEDVTPLLLAIDDAHLLDDASATVVQQLAHEHLVFVVLTVRSGEPCPDAISSLWKDGIIDRLDTEPLSIADTEELLHAVLGQAIDGSTLRLLWNASRGNPLYLHETVLGAVDHRILVQTDDVWRLEGPISENPRLTELVEARLAGLASTERMLLEVLAIGEPLGPKLITDVTQADGITVTNDTLSDLEARGLLTIALDGQRQVVRLAHPLHGEVLRRRMSTLRDIELNRRLADAVEEVGAHRREDVLRVAVWRLDGGGTVQPELMVDAARRAHFALDHPLAERLARASRDAGGGIEAGLILAEALMSQGKMVDCDRVLASVQREAVTGAELALTATSRSSAVLWGLGRAEEAIDILVQAEPNVEPGPWRNEMIGARAIVEMMTGHPIAALDLAEPLLAVDEGRGFVQASIAAGTSLLVCGRFDEAFATIEEGLRRHYALGEQQMLARPFIQESNLAMAKCDFGALAEGAAIAEEGYDAAVARGEKSAQAWFALILGRVYLNTGQLVRADRLFAEGAAAYGDLSHNGPRRWCLAGRVLANVWLGKTKSIRPVAQHLRDSSTTMLLMESDVLRALAWFEWGNNQPERARDLLREAVAVARSQQCSSLELVVLHDLARLGNAADVQSEVAALGSIVEGPLAVARVAHTDALTRRDPEALEAAASVFESAGALIFAAEAAASAAAAHVSKQSRRRSAIAERTATRLLESCDRARTPALAALNGGTDLTDRQLEIARLAATGLASKSIAARLGLSARTVDNHLQKVYQRLGVTSRDDLADALSDDPRHL